MKKFYIFLILVCALIAGLLWFRNHPTALAQTSQTNIVTASQTIPSPLSVQQGTAATPAIKNVVAPEDNTALISNRLKQIEANSQNISDQWRTPIEFYGKVIDENTNPIAGVEINFDCNDTSPTGTSFYHTTSDEGGMFSIKDIKGMLLVVKVKKQGYYPKAPAGYAFYYAGQNQNFVPDATKPVMFDLRKKGTGETLVHFHKSLKVHKDGTPVEIGLATGNVTTSSADAIKVECWTLDKVKIEGWKFDWKCRVSISGGKLQTYNEMYPFLAPADGYMADDVIDMTVKPGVQWTEDVQRSYYFQTAGGKYGRMEFRMIAHGEHFFEVDTYFNPSGSRHLEPIPSE